jgi:putative ABC transport system permease protein
VLAPAQPAAWAAAQERRLRRQRWAALALLMLAAMIARAGEGVVAGFALLAALLLGAALGAPAALSAALRWAERRARAPLMRWLWADARAGLGGLSLALMALLLALSANVGVGTMVGGFRLSFAGWLDQRLAAEIYARAPDPATAAALEAFAAADPRVSALLPTRSAELRLGGWPVEALGLADHATYRDLWPTIAAESGLWDAVAAGTGASVSEQLARRLGLSLGQTLTLPAADGPWALRVMGVHPDYGNPKGQVVVGLDALAARIPDAARGAYGLRANPGEVGAVMAALAAAPGTEAVEAIDQTGVKRLSLGLFDRTFAVTAALNALTLGVAGAALFASLVTLSETRLTQLAPLWAMGLTRRRLARLELLRMLALAGGVAALAVPVGLLLAWALVAVVNVQAFGWRLPLHFFPDRWLGLAALALATAAAAAALPAWRLSRMAPARLVAAFGHDR